VRGGTPAIEQSGFGQDERATAERKDAAPARVRSASNTFSDISAGRYVGDTITVSTLARVSSP
jgi:hypothetical protein